MATKQLRTVKKSADTGRLNRAEVRSAVITVRDSSIGQYKSTGASKRHPASSKSQPRGGGSNAAASRKK